MSAAEALAVTEEVKYQYNTAGNIRALLNSEVEVLLDVKLVQQPYATDDFLRILGGQPGPAGDAQAAGFTLGFRPATALGVETLNEMTGQWRPIVSSATFAVVASFA